jgi:lysozyme
VPSFGKKSKTNLSQCTEELQHLFTEVVKHYDCTVSRGSGVGIEVVPYFKNRPHIREEDEAKSYEFAGFVQGIAIAMDIPIRWGGNWNGTDELHDQEPISLFYFESGTPEANIVKIHPIDKALEVIKAFEGILDGDPSTVNLDPYLCPANYWTIGWGHVVLNAKGKQVKGKSRKSEAYSIYPDGITMQEAEFLLSDDIRRFSTGVSELVHVELKEEQFCALVSFSFNVGIGAFGKSTLLKYLNQGRYKDVPEQLKRWNKAGGKVLSGLVRRREAEADLWMSIS